MIPRLMCAACGHDYTAHRVESCCTYEAWWNESPPCTCEGYQHAPSLRLPVLRVVARRRTEASAKVTTSEVLGQRSFFEKAS